MRLPGKLAFVALATCAVHVSAQVGIGNIKLCYNKNLTGKCTYPMDVGLNWGKCLGVEDNNKKFGDKGSSIGVSTLLPLTFHAKSSR